MFWPKRTLAAAAFFLALLAHPDASQSPPPETAEWVARQMDERDTGRDGRFQLKMRLFDRQQRVRERELTILTLRGRQAGRKGSDDAPPGDRMLIRFTYPNDIKGTGLLVWKHPEGDDERFLYLPALGRIRRIAGAESQDSFVGSDFTYEDISGREFDDYTYTMVDAAASWAPPGGASAPAYRIESRARDAQARFPRVVSTVLKDTFVVVRADIHNRRDERQKVYDVQRLQQIEGIWTIMDAVMSNLADRTRTELSVVEADYHVGLSEASFSRTELERR